VQRLDAFGAKFSKKVFLTGAESRLAPTLRVESFGVFGVAGDEQFLQLA